MFFWLFEPLQEKLQLVGVELLATFSIELLGKSIELAAQEAILGLKAGDALVFVFRRFDAADANSLCLQLR